uniref:Uncharacterized protein n=1 Tax=Oryza sativa subsp. japonica TaxID=39947 RepID=Q69Q52_ORYSJ|nr:hypothetical protein [Oryza sativa Japonica Group]
MAALGRAEWLPRGARPLAACALGCSCRVGPTPVDPTLQLQKIRSSWRLKPTFGKASKASGAHRAAAHGGGGGTGRARLSSKPASRQRPWWCSPAREEKQALAAGLTGETADGVAHKLANPGAATARCGDGSRGGGVRPEHGGKRQR